MSPEQQIRLGIIQALMPTLTVAGIRDPSRIIEMASQLETYVVGSDTNGSASKRAGMARRDNRKAPSTRA